MNTAIDLTKLPRTLDLVLEADGPTLNYIDQRKLPGSLVVESTKDWRVVVDAIKTLAVRGAPAIGIAGIAALTLWAAHGGKERDFERVAEEIASARPTAVNLRWAVERACAHVADLNWEQVPEALIELTLEMEEEDERSCRAIGDAGAALIGPHARILTHCNAGSLATYFYGTALGVVYSAALAGKVERVYADETRPVGQGARLTAWELSRAGVPVTVICDNMAASLMAGGNVDAVVVGADRIAANGDTANKIGTLGVAILAKEHGIPFYVAAPASTVDLSLDDGSQIVIEQRSPDEVMAQPIEGVDVWNPAFDVTPARYITKIVTDCGVYEPGDLARGLAARCSNER